MKKYLILLLAFFTVGLANADDFLTETEIKALFTNNSFNVRNETKGKDVEGYDNDQGEHFIYIPWKDKVSHRKWWTEGATHCTSHPKRGDNCKKMKKAGDGVYHGISDGEHTHTLKNFTKGPRSWQD